MVHLLTIRALVDAHQQRLISEPEITHHQNEAKTSEAINGIEACHMAAMREAEATHATAVREAEATRVA